MKRADTALEKFVCFESFAPLARPILKTWFKGIAGEKTGVRPAGQEFTEAAAWISHAAASVKQCMGRRIR